MSLLSWLWRNQRESRASLPAQPRRACLQVERLETREVLSGSSITGLGTIAESDTYTLALNAGDTPVLQWRIDWGDGVIDTLPGFATSATHVYDDGPRDYTISVQAQQDVAYPFFQWSTASGGNGHYYALTTAPSSWTGAEAEAKALGGHLVSITSQAEQTFVEQTFLVGPNERSIYWIGLTDAEREGTYAWTDGDPFTFNNWQGPNEPNNFGGDEDYATINWHYGNGRANALLGSWNDSTDNGINSTLDGPAPTRGIVEFTSRPLGAVITHTLAVHVENVAPTLEVQGATVTVPGAPVAFTVTAWDVSQADRDAGFTISVDWQSDGVIDQVVTGASAVPGTRFARPGVYTATFTVTDKDGASQTSTQIITVLTAQQQIDVIERQVKELIADGTLRRGQGKALLATLEHASKKIDRGNVRAAIQQLQAAAHQIRALVRKDILPKGDGQELTSLLDDAIATVRHATPAKHCGKGRK